MKKHLLVPLAALVMVLALSAPANAVVGANHWGPEPFYGTGVRYVWVLDYTNNDAVSAQIQRWASWMNSAHNTHPGLPAFFYYQYDNIGCPAQPASQVIQVCSLHGNQYTSTGAAGVHTIWGQVHLYDDLGSGPFTWTSVCHEFGHAVGFQHTSDASSCMTGSLNQYLPNELYYSNTEWSELVALYNHAV